MAVVDYISNSLCICSLLVLAWLFDGVVAINLTAPFLCTKFFLSCLCSPSYKGEHRSTRYIPYNSKNILSQFRQGFLTTIVVCFSFSREFYFINEKFCIVFFYRTVCQFFQQFCRKSSFLRQLGLLKGTIYISSS